MQIGLSCDCLKKPKLVEAGSGARPKFSQNWGTNVSSLTGTTTVPFESPGGECITLWLLNHQALRPWYGLWSVVSEPLILRVC